MLQSYGIVTLGNSSVRLIFLGLLFSYFIFQPNGPNDALLALLFSHQKNYGFRNQLPGRYNPVYL